MFAMTSQVKEPRFASRYTAPVSFGPLLKTLRTQKRISQMQLSFDAEVSTRHLSFLETGKAQPSREMVLVLGSALELPLRDRNLLLEAAGFASVYRHTPWNAPEMAELRHAVELILRAHEPFPAMVLDRHWNVLLGNTGLARVHAMFTGTGPLPSYTLLESQKLNVVQVLADTYRPFMRNWRDVVVDLLPRLERDATHSDELRARIEALRAHPDVPKQNDYLPRAPLVLPVEFSLGELTVKIFSTITTLGTSQDVTTEELRIESFHPADELSRRLLGEALR